MNLVIFGPPGAGKGTQAYYIVKKFNLYQLSSGDLLRNEIQKKTELGNKIEKIISNGDLVTNDIVDALVKKVITNPSYKNRIIYDGYPRNVFQAKSLEQILIEDNQSISFILFLNVSRDVIEKRIMGRLTCEKCNKTFNEHFNKVEIDLHECGKNHLRKRKDDNKETIIRRYDTYMKKTKPVLDFYSSKSYFHEIDGSQKIEVITGKIDQIINV
mgnify:FL=1